METLKPYTLNKITLKNRIVMPPMCMYMAKDGFANLFHVSHYSTRAMGNVGFIIVEATGVTPAGRITDDDLGLWSDDHIEGLKKVVDEVHRYGAKIAIQLQHSGRKSQTTAQPHLAPSAESFSQDYQTPDAMTLKDIQDTVEAFKQAAIRADQAGFDGVELHGAHGYLINQFMSPLANHRSDDYGGSLEIRVSGEEFHPEGNHPEEVAKILEPVKDKLDLIHVSSGGVAVVKPIELKPFYQVEYAKTIKEILNKPVIAVGLITTIEQTETVLKDVELVALGRELLRHPNWVNAVYGSLKDNDAVFKPYRRAFK
jgi:NADPH2 dehydrogenase